MDMNWFYNAINQFYTQNSKNFDEEPAEGIINKLREFLSSTSRENTEQLNYINSQPDHILFHYLKSCINAHQLVEGTDFIIEKNTIIPLVAKDEDEKARPAYGASFNNPVHEFLSTRLNHEGKNISKQSIFDRYTQFKVDKPPTTIDDIPDEGFKP